MECASSSSLFRPPQLKTSGTGQQQYHQEQKISATPSSIVLETTTSGTISLSSSSSPKITPPPSPPPGPPSKRSQYWSRMMDLTCDMEFAYVKYLLGKQELEDLQTQKRVLESLPHGLDAYREDMEKL